MGCVTHRGPWRLDADGAPDDGEGVELVLLANVAPEDRGARAVAQEVEQLLAEERPRIVLWLGNVSAPPLHSATPRAERRGPRCSEPDAAWSGPATTALAQRIGPPSGTPSFAVGGVLDHRCGASAALRQARPWRMPATHYVLRVYTDGSVEERAACGDEGCRFAEVKPSAGANPPLMDLVMIDLSPWLHPSDDAAARHRDAREVDALEAMLAAIAAVPPEAAPPRLLVTSVPVEAAGEHGLGTLWPDASFHGLPVPLQNVLVEGHFAGVLAGHDRSLYASEDLSNAIKRADRAWLGTPVFQVVAGAVSRPNRRAAMALRRQRVRTSQAYSPRLWSDHAGFAVVRVRGEEAEIILHARRGRHWEQASMTVPLRPAPHPVRTPSPHMGPCRDCPPIPASDR